jgi:hypothetical protein
MPNLTASIPHRLSRAEAKRRIQEQVGTLRSQPGTVLANLTEQWTGDTMFFSASAMGQPISGRLMVADHVVHVDVALPWLLAMIAGTVKYRIEQQVTQLLAIAGPAPANG